MRLLADGQFGADADDEGRAVSFSDYVFSLVWSQIGEFTLHFFGMHKGDFLRQSGLEHRVFSTDEMLGAADGVVDAAHGFAQVFQCSLLGSDDFFQSIDRRKGNGYCRASSARDGVHVGIDTCADFNARVRQFRASI